MLKSRLNSLYARQVPLDRNSFDEIYEVKTMEELNNEDARKLLMAATDRLFQLIIEPFYRMNLYHFEV